MPSTSLAAVALGLIAAAGWGAGDFFGGLGSRRASVFLVVLITDATGLLILIAVTLIWREPPPPLATWLWGGTAGLSGALGLTALYRALASGRMGIAAPVAAVIGAAIPVGVGALFEGLPGVPQMAGFALALPAVWLIARSESGPGEARGFGLAILAGVLFAGFFICFERAGQGSTFWPLVTSRVAAVAVLGSIVLGNRQAQRIGGALREAVLAGLFDIVGNVFYVLAAQAGRLDVAVVVSSLYPVGTVILARVLLKEHLTRPQALGIALSAAAIVLIAV